MILMRLGRCGRHDDAAAQRERMTEGLVDSTEVTTAIMGFCVQNAVTQTAPRLHDPLSQTTCLPATRAHKSRAGSVTYCKG